MIVVSQSYKLLNRKNIDGIVRYIRDELKVSVPVTMNELKRLIEELGGGLEGIECDYDSKLEVDGDSFVIKYNTKIDKKRAMFSIGCEIGHIILHLLGSDGKINNNYKENSDTEYENNEFSAELLMPEEEFIRVNKELMRLNIVDLEGIADRFNVTLRMANMRGYVLGLW